MKHSAAYPSLQVRHKSLGRRMLDHWQIYLLLLPAIVYFIIFYYWPMAGLQIAFRDYRVSKGIWGSTWVGLKYFQKFFNHPQCWKIIRNTMVLSLYTLATFPLLTSAIVRSICWIVLLGKKGTINNMLLSLGVISKPLSILYTETSMLIGYIQLFMPLMLLSLVGVMESIDDELILAARTMGCNAVKAFAKVVLPLSVSGLITGSMLVFTGTVTAYATPSLLGGSKTKVLSTLLYQYAYNMNDWMSAAMVAAVMIVITIVINVAFTSVAKRLNRGGAQ